MRPKIDLILLTEVLLIIGRTKNVTKTAARILMKLDLLIKNLKKLKLSKWIMATLKGQTNYFKQITRDISINLYFIKNFNNTHC